MNNMVNNIPDPVSNVASSIQAAANAGHLTPISSQTILNNLNATTVPASIGDQISKMETDIPIVLELQIDESGSLEGYESVIVDAINDTIDDFVRMRAKTGQEIYLRITVFSQRNGVPNVRVLQDYIHVQDCPKLTVADYRPNGMTPLNEAMYDGATATSAFGATLFANGATGVQEVVIILSDGLDNPSGKPVRSLSEFRRLLLELNTKPHFTFGFVGIGDEANFRAFALSAGVPDGNIVTVDKTKSGLTKAFKLISSSMGSKSHSIQTGQTQSNQTLFVV
ncbi:MAG: hypothetical protein AAB966_03355 [Patescibacteria group bacterium]